MNNTKKLQDTLHRFQLPSYNEIPDVGLYLDQVSKYINSYLTDFPEMNVTPSMISNYAKQKLIERVNKKTYTRDQIASLIFIALSKTVVSIDHVRMILTELRNDNASYEEVYNRFRGMLTEILSSLYEPNISYSNETDTAERDRMLRYVAISIAHKMYLERYFDLRQEAEEAEEKQ